MASKYLKRRFKWFYNELETPPTSYIPLRLIRGTGELNFMRSAIDLVDAEKGAAGKCMNAGCAARHRDMIPFKFFGIPIFTETRAYFIVEKDKRGQPYAAIEYMHNNSKDIKVHDAMSPSAIEKMGLAEKVVTLSEIPKPIKLSKAKKAKAVAAISQKKTSVDADSAVPKRRTVPRGSARRAVAAGLYVPDLHMNKLKKTWSKAKNKAA